MYHGFTADNYHPLALDMAIRHGITVAESWKKDKKLVLSG
jgi:hypothetical protein